MSDHQANIPVTEADLSDPAHQEATLHLVNAYADDPMGNGAPLAEEVRRELVPGLRAHPTTMVFLAWDGEPSGQAVGIAVCFRGFSTFAARPLLNIHDVFVLPAHRGRGIGRRIFAGVERRARELGCCKLTLEVQENNHPARRVYAAAGFRQAVHVPAAGGALFLSKPL